MDKLLSNGDGVQGFGFMDLLKQEEPQQPAQQQTVQPRLGSLAQPGPGERGECCLLTAAVTVFAPVRELVGYQSTQLCAVAQTQVLAVRPQPPPPPHCQAASRPHRCSNSRQRCMLSRAALRRPLAAFRSSRWRA